MSFKKKIVLALLFLFAVLLNVFILTHRSGLSDTVEVTRQTQCSSITEIHRSSSLRIR